MKKVLLFLACFLGCGSVAFAQTYPSPQFNSVTVATILGGPAFPVSPTVPTVTAGDSSTKAASDAFVTAGIGVETSRATAAEGTLTTGLTSTMATANAALPNNNTAVGTAYASWFASLPTVLPGTAGQYWNDGGVLAKS